MKKIRISKDWLLKAPGTNGWKPVDLPNDYIITLPRDKNATGGPRTASSSMATESM